jgi:hypothetical protein
MNMPWIIGTISASLFFSFFEWRAFKYPLRQNTLSRFLWTVGQNWPLSIWLMGAFAGCLATHLFWNWCPAVMLPGHGG